MKNLRILFAGGGTGGHVYPAIAIADAIKAQVPDAAIAFAGTKERIEWKAVPKAGYEIYPITVSGFQRKLSVENVIRNLKFPFKLLKGLLDSRSLIKSFQPHVVVGTGGYVSGPVLKMASMAGIPIVLQEQNAYAGATNKMMAEKAAQIHIAFEEAQHYFPKEKCYLNGNPVRQSLTQVNPTTARKKLGLPEDALVLFIFGGSLGSIVLNNAVQAHYQALLEKYDNLYILWQTGKAHYTKLHSQIVAHERLKLMEYVDDMDTCYAASDLVLCRAGAISCSELMVTGTPAILVPAKNVAEDHQTKNAKAMVNVGAALMIDETELGIKFLETVEKTLADKTLLKVMRHNAKNAAKPNAANNIANHILTLCN